jgi:transcriptional regulator with XRE-family HTH domain
MRQATKERQLKFNGAKLRDARKAAGLTQQAVAKTLGLHQTTVARWEQGKFEPSLTHGLRLAELYNVEADDFTEKGQ